MNYAEKLHEQMVRVSNDQPDACRKFETGATRSADQHRDDPEGFLSPLVLDRFSEYMSKHRVQADGTLRDSDNWQKGMPKNTYMKGMWRHFLHLWTRHRGFLVRDPGAAADIEEDLCAILFNVMGYLFELLKDKYAQPIKDDVAVEIAFPSIQFYGGSSYEDGYRAAIEDARKASPWVAADLERKCPVRVDLQPSPEALEEFFSEPSFSGDIPTNKQQVKDEALTNAFQRYGVGRP